MMKFKSWNKLNIFLQQQRRQVPSSTFLIFHFIFTCQSILFQRNNFSSKLISLLLLVLITCTQMSHEKSAGTKSLSTSESKDNQQHQQFHEPFLGMNSNETIIVETLLGKIRGRLLSFTTDKSHYVGAFLGIPYAESPVRELRFRAPIPPKPWSETLNATDFSAICYQPGEQKIYDIVNVRNRSAVRRRKLENFNMSEDCLTLNIYVPLTEKASKSSNSDKSHNSENVHKPNENSDKLPVFFYIHGGSYYMGAGRLYPGQILAAKQNLIVVTFNFRLGPLGFFSSGDAAAPGNYGLLDQAQALNWVHQNIDSFGGDKDRITIVGNSAGGASVLFHLVSPISKGKFVGATIQSGCTGAPWAIQPNPAKHAVDLAKKLGCPTVPTTDMVDCIRTFSPKVIMKNANLEDGLSLAYAAVIDGNYGGKFISAHPDTLIKQNQFEHVPILGGFTKDEVTIWFTKLGPSAPTKHLIDFLEHDIVSLLKNIPGLTEANQAAAIHSVKVQYLYRYGISLNDTVGKTTAVSDFISDVGLKAPCIKEMNLLAKYNTKPVYLYEFHYYSIDDVKMNRQEWIGSYHESELQFIFGEAYLNYSNHLRSYDDKKISDLMMKTWANFVRYGNPTPPITHKTSSMSVNERPSLKFSWHNYTQLNQDFAILGLKSRMEKYYYTERMLFWNFFFPIFSDYTFTFPTTAIEDVCSGWSFIPGNWILWLLISIIACLTCLIIILCFCHVRYWHAASNIGNKNIKCHQQQQHNRHYHHNHNNHHHSHGLFNHPSHINRSSSCFNSSTIIGRDHTDSAAVTNNNINASSTRRYSHPHSKNNMSTTISAAASATKIDYLNKTITPPTTASTITSSVPNNIADCSEIDVEHQIINNSTTNKREQRLISISSN